MKEMKEMKDPIPESVQRGLDGLDGDLGLPLPPAIKPASVTLVHYRCTNCEAEDIGKYFIGVESDHIIPAINCWKCGAGRKMTSEDQIAAGIGMLMYIPKEQEQDKAEQQPS